MQILLPMLDSAVVEPGWISEPDFLTDVALVQAMPGPLFNVAAYVGNHSTLCYDAQIVACGLSLQIFCHPAAAFVMLLLLWCCSPPAPSFNKHHLYFSSDQHALYP